jgi:YD repeat-containing protein
MLERCLVEGETEMRSWIFALVLGLLTAGLAFTTLADEATYDDQGRLSRVVRDDGVTIDYVYDADGNLIEERSSDGSVIYHPVDDETS